MEEQLKEKLKIQQLQEQRFEVQLQVNPKFQLKVQQNRYLDKQLKVQFEEMKTNSPNEKLRRKLIEELNEQMKVLRRLET